MNRRGNQGESRRDFLRRAATGVATIVVAQRASAETRGTTMHRMPGMTSMPGMPGMATVQQRGTVHDSSLIQDSSRDTTNLFVMNQHAARAVVRPPKRDAVPLLNDSQRDELEHRIRCQCGCTLDVFTCRTTDFSCQVSPAMHRDVMALVQGGYSAQEIIDAFVQTYGERVLMSPGKAGFNLLAWVTPGFALVVGGVVVAVLVRRWGRNSPQTPGQTRGAHVSPSIEATPDELARLDAAIKGDDDA